MAYQLLNNSSVFVLMNEERNLYQAALSINKLLNSTGVAPSYYNLPNVFPQRYIKAIDSTLTHNCIYTLHTIYFIRFHIVIYQTPLRLLPPPSAPSQGRRERSSMVLAKPQEAARDPRHAQEGVPRLFIVV